MIDSAVIERYARAIFELGVESGQLSGLTTELGRFAAAYESSKDLRVALENPLVPEAERDLVLKDMATRIGVGETGTNAIRLLAQRRRMAALPEIARRLGSMADEKAGVVRAKVISAVPLSEDFYSRLGQKLEQKLAKKVVLERETDPSLIGGIITKIGDNTIDGSLRGRLAALESQLLRT
jgi:F-type H+-transporting ATPase subunit delta